MTAADMPEPILLEPLQVLRLQPGDILVMTYPMPLSSSFIERLRAQLRERFPEHEVMVLDSGGHLGVVREDYTDGS